MKRPQPAGLQCAYFASEVRCPTKAMLRAGGWVDEGYVPSLSWTDHLQHKLDAALRACAEAPQYLAGPARGLQAEP